MRSWTIDVPSALALALIAFWVATMAAAFGTTRGFVADAGGTPVESDYVGVYTAGKLALAGEPAAAYDADRHAAIQHELLHNPDSRHYPWSYPPFFLAVAAAFATLPFALSMLAWIAASGAIAGLALYRISASRRDFLLMLAAPALWLNFYVGQNGGFSAGLIGLGLWALPTRPVLAGICIGLLSFKPHLGLLLPIALLAGRYYRAFVAAGATVVTLILASLALFGSEPWLAMPDQLRHISAILGGSWSFEKIQSTYGFGRASGLSAEVALSIQLALTVALAAGIAWVWHRQDVPYDLKAAALAAAVTLATPYQFVYDLVVLTIAQAFLLRHLAYRPSSMADLAGLGFANLLIFLFARTPLPLGVAGSALVLGLIVRRMLLDRRPVGSFASRPTSCPIATTLPLAARCVRPMVPREISGTTREARD